MRRLATSEGGFGLVELLIAMTVMVIGITAIVAGFSSGMVALNRASRASTAATLADKQMEAYRAIQWSSIMVNGSLVSAADATYSSDSALAGDAQTDDADITDTMLGSTCSSTLATCMPVQTVTGPDGRSYRVDSYVVWTCGPPTSSLSTSGSFTDAAPGCSDTTASRPLKRVTVVVRDPSTPTTVLFRESSTFDQATG